MNTQEVLINNGSMIYLPEVEPFPEIDQALLDNNAGLV